MSDEGKELAKKRRETVERIFADSKCNHGFRYAVYKGVKKNQHYTWLSCAAQNMKNEAIKIDKLENKYSKSMPAAKSCDFLSNFIKSIQNLLKVKNL